jgi:TorA maturation chaperone TorD
MANNLKDLTTEELALLLNGLPLLSRALWGPDPAWCEEIRHAAATDELTRMGAVADEGEAAQTMTDCIKRLGDSEGICMDLEEAYVRLFVSNRGGITASLQHSAYESADGRLMGRPVRMMANRLKAVGLAPPREESVPEDHLAFEIEYMTLLLHGAFNNGDEESLEAARNFALTELKPFVEQFSKKLQGEEASPFYPALARLLLAAVSLIAA